MEGGNEPDEKIEKKQERKWNKREIRGKGYLFLLKSRSPVYHQGYLRR